MKKILISGLIFILSGCYNSKNDEKSPQTERDFLIGNEACDTLLLFTLRKLEQLDSIVYFDEKKKARSFEYYFLDSSENVVKLKFPIVNLYHDSLSLKVISEDSVLSRLILNDINYDLQNNVISPHCFKDYRLIDELFLREMIKLHDQDKLNEKFEYYTFSKPILLNNGDLILIEMDRNCGGFCGEGVTYLIEKEGEDWVIKRRLVRWLSDIM
jgi:hypothetical protein